MSNNTQSFIDKLSPIAIKHGNKNNILPSLIIAQGCLESSFGQSELAVNANNLFGIKKGSGWNGEIYAKKTSEQKSNGTVYYIVAEFRKYPSYEGCVESLCHKYTHGTGWENFNRYQNVVGERNYKKATKALIEAGYATDIKYAEKLKRVIEQYDLTKFDKGGGNMAEKFKIAVCAGHSKYDTYGKQTPDGEKEWVFNDKVLRAFVNEISKYENVEVRRFDDPTGKVDIPLSTRTDNANAWGADIYISFHHNANTGKWGNWTGTETFIYTYGSKESLRLAQCVHSRQVEAYGLSDRGIKRGNLHIVRETKMPAILLEGCFMDSVIDIKKLRDDNVLRDAGIGVALGVAQYASLKKDTKSSMPTQSNKGGVRMLDITSPALKKLALQTIEDMTDPKKYENPLSKVWLDKAVKGELPLDDAVGLLLTEINMKKK